MAGAWKQSCDVNRLDGDKACVHVLRQDFRMVCYAKLAYLKHMQCTRTCDPEAPVVNRKLPILSTELRRH